MKKYEFDKITKKALEDKQWIGFWTSEYDFWIIRQIIILYMIGSSMYILHESSIISEYMRYSIIAVNVFMIYTFERITHIEKSTAFITIEALPKVISKETILGISIIMFSGIISETRPGYLPETTIILFIGLGITTFLYGVLKENFLNKPEEKIETNMTGSKEPNHD